MVDARHPVSFLDAVLGRSKPKQANLDALFGLPSAAVTLQADAGLVPTGKAGVCYKPASGAGFASAKVEFEQLLRADQPESSATVTESDDAYGYHWIVLHSPEVEELVGAAHLVNSTLQDHGFGPQLLCSAFGLLPASPADAVGADPAGGAADPEELAAGGAAWTGPPRLALVYLYKRGTFYPFAPLAGERRDNEAELRLRAIIGADLPIEQDLSRWFPIWGLPVLS